MLNDRKLRSYRLDLRPDLARIACPTLALVPDSDPEHPPAEYEVLRDGVAGIRFVTMEAACHKITDVLPDRCARELRAFLEARISDSSW
jgi:3-oxoadipate enol-lactonase